MYYTYNRLLQESRLFIGLGFPYEGKLIQISRISSLTLRERENSLL